MLCTSPQKCSSAKLCNCAHCVPHMPNRKEWRPGKALQSSASNASIIVNTIYFAVTFCIHTGCCNAQFLKDEDAWTKIPVYGEHGRATGCWAQLSFIVIQCIKHRRVQVSTQNLARCGYSIIWLYFIPPTLHFPTMYTSMKQRCLILIFLHLYACS